MLFSSHFLTHLKALICSLSLNLESSFVSFPSVTTSYNKKIKIERVYHSFYNSWNYLFSHWFERMNSGNFASEYVLALYRVLGLWSIAMLHLSTKLAKRFLMLYCTCEDIFLFYIALLLLFLRVNIKSVKNTQANLISYQLLIPLHAIYNQCSIVKVSS